MAHEILTVKLCQLNERLDKLHSRIHISETAGHDRLQQEIAALQQECAQTDDILQKSLHRSKAPLAAVLAQNYEQIEGTIRQAACQLTALEMGCPTKETAVEGKILLAEYALDFAQRAAERALLISLEAIDAQRLLERQEGSIS